MANEIKIRRKSDGMIKSAPEELASQILQDPDYEPVDMPMASTTAAPVEVPAAPATLMTDINDLAGGIAQGGTLGFSDEIIGGTKAAGDKLKSLLTGQKAQDFLDLYRKYQQEEQAKLDVAKERSPWLYGGGELLGTVGAGLLTAGGGAAAGAGRIAAKTAGKDLAKLALTGAGMGAVQSAGSSKGNLSSEEGREQLASDIKGGAILGGVLSPAVGVGAKVLGKGASKLADKFEDNSYLRQLKKSFERGKTGDLIDEGIESTTKQSRGNIENIKSLSDKILAADEVIGKQFGDVIDRGVEAGYKVQIDDSLNKGLSAIKNLFQENELFRTLPEADKMLEAFNSLISKQGLNPREAVFLRDKLNEYARKNYIPGASPIFKQIDKDILEKLKGLDGFEAVNKLYSDFRKMVPETLIGSSKRFGSYRPEVQSEKVEKKIGQLIKEFTMPGTKSGEAKLKATELVDNLGNLDKKYPGILENLGIGSKEEFMNELVDKADKMAIERQALGYEPQSSSVTQLLSSLFGSSATTGRGIAIGAANRAGYAAKKVGDVAKSLPGTNSVIKLSRNLYDAPEEELRKIAQDLKTLPALSNLGDTLERGLNEKNQALKNAALFSILQNPNARQLFGGSEEKQ